MFLNCLLLDLTIIAIDLMSIVHMDKIIGSKLQKNLKCGRPGGGGVFSDFGHPRTRGEGGHKKTNSCGRPLWMAPNLTRCLRTLRARLLHSLFRHFWWPCAGRATRRELGSGQSNHCRFTTYRHRFAPHRGRASPVKVTMTV